MDWMWMIVALLLGLAVGGAAAYLVMKRRFGDRESVADLRSEYDRYRGKVTEHFVETADLVNTLTRSYKRVYDHLEEGAYELVGEETLRRRLDAPHEEPVMIEYLGRRRSEPEAIDEGATAPVGVGARPQRPTDPRERSETASGRGSAVGSSVKSRDEREEAGPAGPEARLERDASSQGVGEPGSSEGGGGSERGNAASPRGASTGSRAATDPRIGRPRRNRPGGDATGADAVHARAVGGTAVGGNPVAGSADDGSAVDPGAVDASTDASAVDAGADGAGAAEDHAPDAEERNRSAG